MATLKREHQIVINDAYMPPNEQTLYNVLSQFVGEVNNEVTRQRIIFALDEWNMRNGTNITIDDLELNQDIKLNNVNYRAIGGSYGLYLQGYSKSYHDVDIIVDNIDSINLPYKELPLTRKIRMNRTKKYLINGLKFDFIENKEPFEAVNINSLKVQNKDYILAYRKKLGKFIAENYKEENNKFLN